MGSIDSLIERFTHRVGARSAVDRGGVPIPSGWGEEFEADVVRVAELKQVRGTNVLDTGVCDALLVERGCCCIQFLEASNRETEMVKTNPVFIEPVARRCDGSEPEQPTTNLVDHTTEKEPECLTSRVVGLSWHFIRDWKTKDVVVELAGPGDIGNGEPNMCVTEGRDRHGSDHRQRNVNVAPCGVGGLVLGRCCASAATAG